MHIYNSAVKGTTYVYANEYMTDKTDRDLSTKYKATCIGKYRDNGEFSPNKYLKQLFHQEAVDPTMMSAREQMILSLSLDRFGNSLRVKASESDDNNKMLDVIRTAQQIHYGPQLIFGSISKKYGLERMLVDALNADNGKAVLALAWFITSEGSALSNNDSWLPYYLNPNGGAISSQDVTRLLDDIQYDDIMTFYKSWMKRICGDLDKTEKILYDLTSISSYSKRIPGVEYGHNRDHDGLPQINYALLCVRGTGMPLYAWPMNGSINDITTLEDTMKLIEKLDCLPLCLMMDRGFASKSNITFLFTKKLIFLQTLKCDFNWVQDIIDIGNDQLFSPLNRIGVDGRVFYGTITNCKWVVYRDATKKNSADQILVYPCKKKGDIYVAEDKNVQIIGQYTCKACVYFCHDLVGNQFDHFTDELAEEYNRLIADEKAQPKKQFVPYFHIERKKYARKRTVAYNVDQIKEHRNQYAGYVCYLTNDPSIKSAEDALVEYSTRDQIEKDFDEMKNAEDMKRLRVWERNRIMSRLFIQFVAEIHMRELHCRLKASKDCCKLTQIQIANHIKTICKIRFKGKYRDVQPTLTKSQRDIIAAMGID